MKMIEKQDAGDDERKRWIAAEFGKSASTYDHAGPRFFSHFGERLVEVAQLQSKAHVLDVGTGRGAVLFPTARCLSQDGRVIGIDLSEVMVRETVAEIARFGFMNAEVCVMDAENLRFPDASFDHVFCGFSIMFFPDLKRALGEYHRVLKPGGRFIASTFANNHFGFPRMPDWFNTQLAKLPPQIIEAVLSQVQKLSGFVFEKPVIKAMMREAGFGDVHFVEEDAEFVCINEEEVWSSFLSAPVMRIILETIERMGEPEFLSGLKADASEMFETQKQSDGIHHIINAVFTLSSKPPLD
jgi:ubiquinone/menaquinone biosynthesis C-methylase UbiE